MAKCEFCGKGVAFGCKVSHSMRHSNRSWKPNIRQGDCGRDSQACLRLHPLPAFRQSDPRRVTPAPRSQVHLKANKGC